MIRVFLLALLLAAPALAQQAETPRISVALDPSGPVIVGTPVEVTVTLLVPSYMPQPPVWPDLQIADAITRLPERSTHPVTQRIGGESWSGLARTWEIIPQRAADFDLGGAEIEATYADPASNAPVQATVPLPAIGFSATVPPGAEGLDPFLAATSLTVTASVDGLPAAPKPGDAFTLTLVTTAAGPPAMLLPPLADRLPALPGLRAYPRQPTLADTAGGSPTATRTEAIAFVIEAPGTVEIPSVSLGWWNTATAARATATTQPVTIEVAAPHGWRDNTGPTAPQATPWRIPALIAAAIGFALALLLLLRRRPRERDDPPSERWAYRALRRAIRNQPTGTLRPALATWRTALAAPIPAARAGAIEGALRALERLAYGRVRDGASDAAARRQLLSAVAAARSDTQRAPQPALPALNPAPAPNSLQWSAGSFGNPGD